MTSRRTTLFLAVTFLALFACTTTLVAQDAQETQEAPSRPRHQLPEGATMSQPFNGTDLTGWKSAGDPEKSFLTVGSATMSEEDPTQLTVAESEEEQGQLVNAQAHGLDFYSEQKFGTGIFIVEFMVPQGSNSGIYLMGEYEVQILDSYGRETVGPGDVGGIYGAQAPKENASRAPGEWQRMVIVFQAPKFDGGEKVENAKFVRIILNRTLIQEDVEMEGVTPGGLTGEEHPTGPLMFQGNHGPVAFRNLRVVELEELPEMSSMRPRRPMPTQPVVE